MSGHNDINVMMKIIWLVYVYAVALNVPCSNVLIDLLLFSFGCVHRTIYMYASQSMRASVRVCVCVMYSVYVAAWTILINIFGA